MSENSIDFLKLTEKYKEAAIKDLQDILKIKSVFDETTITKTQPFGFGINEALEHMLKLAKRDGFTTFNDEGYVGVIEHGESEEEVGVLCHLDVVPEGNKWIYPPYSATICDNKIYARGAMDDKGPTIAAYYALKMLKDNNIKLNKKIKIILGTDEETLWRGISHYAINHKLPEIGFAPDADFPLIYGEKGILHITFTKKFDDEVLLSFKSGERFNIVSDFAEAITNKKYRDEFEKYCETNNLAFKYDQIKDEKSKQALYKYTVYGKAVHAMEPEKGKNAGTHLANFLGQFITNPILNFVGDYLHEEYNLGKLCSNSQEVGINNSEMGLSHPEMGLSHPEMGLATCNVGIITYDSTNRNSENSKICIDIRYPIGFNYDMFMDKLAKQCRFYGLKYSINEHKVPHYVDPNDELVQTLYKAYAKYSGDTIHKPITIGGGTYARALKHAVAFGMEMPDTPSLAHQPNECIDITNFMMTIAIYAEALMELCK